MYAKVESVFGIDPSNGDCGRTLVRTPIRSLTVEDLRAAFRAVTPPARYTLACARCGASVLKFDTSCKQCGVCFRG